MHVFAETFNISSVFKIFYLLRGHHKFYLRNPESKDIELPIRRQHRMQLMTSPLECTKGQAEHKMEDAAVPKKRRLFSRSVIIQVLVGVIANLSSIAPGMNLGFSAVALPAMKNASHVPQVTEEEGSWIASLASISTPVGCLLSGPLLEALGRRLTLATINLPGLVGWILLATVPHNATSPRFLAQVYAGRLFTGFSTGMASVPATVYVSETSDQTMRGMLVTWTSIAMSLGILAVYAFGALLQTKWRIIAGLCCIPMLLSCVLAPLLPESPVWLNARGRTDEATHSLRRLRGLRTDDHTPLPPSVQAEVEALFARSVSSSEERKRERFSFVELLRTLRQPKAWKPLLVMVGFFFFQQFSGIFVVIFYAVDIAEEIGMEADGYLITVLIGIARLVVTIIISYLSKRYGRRPLAIISGVGMVICMGFLTGFLQFGKVGENIGSWLPGAALVLYILTSTIGFLTLPWAMNGEVFPSNIRGLASAFTTCLAYTFSFVTTKVYPDMKDAMSIAGVFLFYTIMGVLGTVFVYFFLPETQGKTLAQIEADYEKGWGTSRASRKDTVMKEVVDEGLLPLGNDKPSPMIIPMSNKASDSP